MKVAVVGAGGFVGRPVMARLRDDGHEVVPIVRTARGMPDERQIDDLASADWPNLFTGVEAVVHLAARVHVMNDTAADPLAEHRRVNCAGTMKTAEGAAAAGVKRFIFISTIKVNGEETKPGRPASADDQPEPVDPYGISKLEAEQALFELAGRCGMEVTVIRPPLVHGPGVRANFESLMKLVQRRVPLPIGLVTQNRRSLVGVDNLADLISVCLAHAAAAGQRFMASDGHDVSTRELAEMLGTALGVRPRLLPVPIGSMRLAARIAGKEPALNRLLGDLQVDITKNRELLGWSPPVTLQEGLRRAAAPMAKRVDNRRNAR